MAFKLENPLKPVRNFLDLFSISSRDGIKSAVKWGIGVPLAGFIFTSAAPVLLATAGVIALAARGGLSVWRNGTLGDLTRGREERNWTNEAGQDVRGTRNQQQDLRAAQRAIDRVVKGAAGLSAKEQKKLAKITRHFNSAAEKVTVVKDIENNNGTYRYAHKYSQIVVNQVIKPL